MHAFKLLPILLCTGALFTFAGCSPDSTADSATAKVEDTSVLRWGSDENGSAPFLYRDSSDPTRQIGFEKEIADEIGKRLGKRVEFVQTAWDSLLPALNRGDFDFAMSGIEITESRSEQVTFTDSYYVSTKQLVVRAADADIKSLSDLTDRPVGTLMESTSEKYLRSNTRCEVRTYDDGQHPYDDLANGTIDGVLLDLPIAEFYARPNKDLRFAGKPVGPGNYAIAVRKKDQALREQLNAALSAMRTDGSLQKILERWNLWNDVQTSDTVVAATGK